jgi:hypothetical protein
MNDELGINDVNGVPSYIKWQFSDWKKEKI